MNAFKFCLPVALFCLLSSAAVPVKNSYTLSKDYSVTIDGTSNLHNWSEKVETVTGSGIVNWNSDGSFDLEMISIRMDIHSIKSDMGAVMNNNTYKALKADANPHIIYTLRAPVQSIQAGTAGKIFTVKGSLAIAGVTRLVDMSVKIRMPDAGKLAFEGSYALKMSDYDIEAPTALFGTLKTGNEITIHFKTSLTITPHKGI